MVEIPESLLRRSAEAKAKALGVPVEQVLAEMKGEGPPVEVPRVAPVEKPEEGDSGGATMPEGEPEPAEEVPSEPAASAETPEVEASTPEVEVDMDQHVAPAEPKTGGTPAGESAQELVAEAGPSRLPPLPRRSRHRTRPLRLPAKTPLRLPAKRLQLMAQLPLRMRPMSRATVRATGRSPPRSAPVPRCHRQGSQKGSVPSGCSPWSRPGPSRTSRRNRPTRSTHGLT